MYRAHVVCMLYCMYRAHVVCMLYCMYRAHVVCMLYCMYRAHVVCMLYCMYRAHVVCMLYCMYRAHVVLLHVSCTCSIETVGCAHDMYSMTLHVIWLCDRHVNVNCELYTCLLCLCLQD